MASETWCGAAFAGFPCKKSLGHGGPHVYGDRPAASRPGAPEEGIIPQDADLVRRIVRDAQRRPLSGTETVYLRSLAASLAALTSEVARLNARHEFDRAREKDWETALEAVQSEVARLTEDAERWRILAPKLRTWPGGGCVHVEAWIGEPCQYMGQRPIVEIVDRMRAASPAGSPASETPDAD